MATIDAALLCNRTKDHRSQVTSSQLEVPNLGHSTVCWSRGMSQVLHQLRHCMFTCMLISIEPPLERNGTDAWTEAAQSTPGS